METVVDKPCDGSHPLPIHLNPNPNCYFLFPPSSLVPIGLILTVLDQYVLLIADEICPVPSAPSCTGFQFADTHATVLPCRRHPTIAVESTVSLNRDRPAYKKCSTCSRRVACLPSRFATLALIAAQFNRCKYFSEVSSGRLRAW